ncbi:unnamed protein product [Aspergillus oryzae]|nr:unnamed protein product [Aspergillus oryzae]GMF91519.1 unnamed protein product [Aspergillus oryzae]
MPTPTMWNLLERQSNGSDSGTDGRMTSIRVYLLAIVTSMGAFLFGHRSMGAGILTIYRDFGLEHASKAVEDAFSANIVSLLQAGCFFGSLISAPLSDRFGRKLALGLAGLIFCVGSTLQVATLGREAVMFVGRFVGGLAVGAASMLVPLYTAECSPPHIRGRLVGIFEIGVQVGMCIGFWINYAVGQTMAPSTSQWLTPFAIQFIPGGLLIIGLLFLPESPRWTARVRGKRLARQTLSYLRGLPESHPSVESELNDIITQLEDERADNPGKRLWIEIKELTHPGIRARLFLGFMIMVFCQMAGSNAINHYSPLIFRSIGLTGRKTTLISTGLYGVVRLVAVCIAIFLTLAIPFVWLMVPETKELKLEEVDGVFRNRTSWGRREPQLPCGDHADPCSLDAERGKTERVRDVKSAGVKEVEKIDTLKRYWLNTLPD